jgi:hypothetical protein
MWNTVAIRRATVVFLRPTCCHENPPRTYGQGCHGIERGVICQYLGPLTFHYLFRATHNPAEYHGRHSQVPDAHVDLHPVQPGK